METDLIIALDKYFNDLSKIGYVKSKDLVTLKLLMFIYKILSDVETEILITKDQKEKLIKLFNCLTANNCFYEYSTCID